MLGKHPKPKTSFSPIAVTSKSFLPKVNAEKSNQANSKRTHNLRLKFLAHLRHSKLKSPDTISKLKRFKHPDHPKGLLRRSFLTPKTPPNAHPP